MDKPLASVRLLAMLFAGWLNRDQQVVIDYLQEENGVPLEKIGGQRPDGA